MTKRVLHLAFVCLLMGGVVIEPALAARFRRLAYPNSAQYLDGAIVAADSVSYYIVGVDGVEKCYSRKGIEIVSQNPLEDAAILARNGYGEEALASYEKELASATGEATRDEIGRRMVALAPLIKKRATMERLAAAFPRSATVQYWLGRALLLEGRYADASKHMLEAAELDRSALDYRVGLAEARLWMAQAALCGGRLPEARQILTEIPYSASVPAELRWLARDDFRSRLADSGAGALLEYDPYLFLGRYLVDSQEFALAGPYLLAASEKHPKDPVVHNYLAHVFLDLGRSKDADAEMRRGDRNPANHPPLPERVDRLVEVRRAFEAQQAALDRQQQAVLRQKEEAERQARLKAAAEQKQPPLMPGEVRIQ